MASDLYGSGTPARVLFLEAGAERWADVPASVLAHLQHAVSRGLHAARAGLPGGRWHLYDFSRMLRYDEADPAAPPAALAWFDEGGNAFFPPGPVTSRAGVEPCAGLAVGEEEAVAVVRSWTFNGAVITGAQKCVPTATRLRVFQQKEETLGNVKLGWYGGAPADVRMAAEAFFPRPNWVLLGEQQAHGHGLHLAPLRFPHLSMSIAEADYKGEAHMLLCRIVQGMPEIIPPGSDWIDREGYIGGVDYLSNPSWYVIWSRNMDSCIIPLCLVSFVKHPMIQDLGPLPILVTVNMQKLHKEFKRFLPSSKLQTLETYFNVNMGNSYNFSKAVCELVGAAMFVGAIIKSLEY
ncbi:hypothetical protein ACP70R_020772 [Stipagrostis hirtigluma subsp. patula]